MLDLPAIIVKAGNGRSVWLGGMEVISPAGFETCFIEFAEADDPDQRRELATKYGVTYSSDWVAGLTARYHLKLLGH